MHVYGANVTFVNVFNKNLICISYVNGHKHKGCFCAHRHSLFYLEGGVLMC